MGKHTRRGHQNPRIQQAGTWELARRTRHNARIVGWRQAISWLYREGRATRAIRGAETPRFTPAARIRAFKLAIKLHRAGTWSCTRAIRAITTGR